MEVKSVLISIQPKWCELIASGKKTVEVRKTRPKLDTPFKVYIYCTHNGTTLKEKFKNIYTDFSGKVIGEFVCREIDRIAHCGTCNNDIRLRLVDKKLYCKELSYEYLSKCKLSYSDVDEYSNGRDVYGWHISDLVIYEKPKELSGFCSYNCSVYVEGGFPMPTHEIKRPPQSWCYVEGGAE
jgi:predicted transcriptional regulator